jgi:arginine exporter protein ArgO
MIIFFAGVFATVLFFDILKAAGAYSLKRFFTEKMMKLLNQITGVILMIFGLFIAVRVIFFPITL